ncbi:aldehyde ferredoxin oxidoreductase [Dehalobacter sp. DCM]|uniref:aldehyde ferredoxin oxidoreductase N-terminal domain-containing protein n=1 Tax=Dehalobacter sp. DCM TaxID=2907827 RepID=UPI00308171BC|nr:aldehyde ferredoxin oxidoreductase [Dehalobacter sp. DCM]
MNKVYRINLKTKAITEEAIKEEYLTFGNRGLISKVMTDEVDPKCDPLGPDNKMIIAMGLFSGTAVPTSNRLSVGGKSPLTGGIKEANVGGTIGYMFGQHGIKMIICEDQPADDSWIILYVNREGTIQLLPADQYLGLNNYVLVEKLKEDFNNDIAVLSIGVAGERLYRSASLQATDFATGHPARSVGRGGLGALAGSKKIKAIIVEKPAEKAEVTYVDKEKFQAALKKMAKLVVEDPAVEIQRKVGTTGMLVSLTGPTGVLPVHNFSGEFFPKEKLDEISADRWLIDFEKNGSKAGLGCQPGCLVRCSNAWNNSKKEFVTAGLEYETVAMIGPNCDISDMEFLMEADRFCDDIGIDTIEFGVAIGICMEAGKIAWGDIPAVKAAMQEMYDGTEFGNLLGDGAHATGVALNCRKIPTTKKQAMAAYEPRNVKGNGVTFATSPMGADHTAGNTLRPFIDGTKKENAVNFSKENQIVTCLADNMSCTFITGALMTDPTIVPDLMAGLYGGEWNMDKVIGIGAQTLMMERAYNKAVGFTDADDLLPEFFYKEKSPATGAIFDITPEEMKEAYN